MTDTLTADPLQTAFERFLTDGDDAGLLAAVSEFGGRAPSEDLDCPIAHRICDVRLGQADFRVVRVADLGDRTTRLYIYPTVSASTQPGVPFALQGAALWRWIEDELQSPTDERVDLSRYDASLRG
ncbi:hypothetical protein [Roseateles sp. P5_E7]